MLRLSNSTLVIIKHWRPIPKLGEPSIFVVAIDDSPASMRALEQVRACPRVRARPRAAWEMPGGRSPGTKEVALHKPPRALLARRARTRRAPQVLYVAKPTDQITCVTVSHHHVGSRPPPPTLLERNVTARPYAGSRQPLQPAAPSLRGACAPQAWRGTQADRAAGGCAGQGTKDDALIAKADDMLAKHHGDVAATSRAKYYQMAKEGETAAEVIASLRPRLSAPPSAPPCPRWLSSVNARAVSGDPARGGGAGGGLPLPGVVQHRTRRALAQLHVRNGVHRALLQPAVWEPPPPLSLLLPLPVSLPYSLLS
jgi:hypothetical protein